MKRMACVFALAAGASLTGVIAAPALSEPNAAAASGLQVNIVPIGSVTSESTIPLDVKFRGGNIKVIELFVDGVRLARQPLSTRDGRGVVHFTLDPSVLSDGNHEVLVKAYEADGSCATTSTTVAVTPADANALARFEWPRRSSEVQGIVPIRVKIDSSINEPWVTFTVDNEFLAFRNYAPYTYNWDTGKLTNGVHTIGVEVIDGATAQVIQKLSLVVNVKNAGGYTTVQKPTAKPAIPATTGAAVEAVQSAAESALPTSNVAATGAIPGAVRSISTHSPIAPLRRGAPEAMRPVFTAPVSAMPMETADLVTAISPSVTVPTMGHSRLAAPTNTPPVPQAREQHIAPGLSALAANPRDLMLAPSGATTLLARQDVRFHRITGVALRPGTERHASHASAFSTPAARTPVRSEKPRFVLRDMKTFQVAFNSMPIAFDVPPRVENGIALAPFRAIFEHAGGSVKWNNEAKVVQAVDSEREIEIHIGKSEALVNNKPLALETIPYIDRGRTIVPLSFIRDAMDLKVTFDAETGHLMIEKK